MFHLYYLFNFICMVKTCFLAVNQPSLTHPLPHGMFQGPEITLKPPFKTISARWTIQNLHPNFLNKGPPFERSAKKNCALGMGRRSWPKPNAVGQHNFFYIWPKPYMFLYLAKALAIRRGSNWLWEEGTELGHVHLLFTSLKSKLIWEGQK